MEKGYRIDFNEAFRGESDTSGSVYSTRRCETGWVWKLTEYFIERIIEEEEDGSYEDIVQSREPTALLASHVVFENLGEAKANAVKVLRIIEPDVGRCSPINEALKNLALGRY